MGSRKITVRESAADSIAEVAWFIESYGMIATAEKFTDDVYDFIETIMGNAAELTAKLYNYNNIIHYEYESITFDFFEDLLNNNYEIVSYTNEDVSKHRVVKNLKLLRKIYNWETAIF